MTRRLAIIVLILVLLATGVFGPDQRTHSRRDSGPRVHD
jgi:hypothetical protein